MRIARSLMLMFCLTFILASCATTSITPPPPKAEIPEEDPELKTTKYTGALNCFGKLLDIYRDNTIFIQTKDITDKTGTASSTGGEIPIDITEMVKSAINIIGDRVVYIPHDPEYIMSEYSVGSRFQRKLPDIVISGAITEFDRAVESTGSGIDASVGVGGGKAETDVSFGVSESKTFSKITLDMNIIDFKSMAMVPKMQAINTIKVFMTKKEYGFGFAVFGTGIGISGALKKIQGRHGALRLLVELSILELLGRYTNTPYWRCVPDGREDQNVTDRLTKFFLSQAPQAKTKALQEILNYHGYLDIKLTGKLDAQTKKAVDTLRPQYSIDPLIDYLDPRVYIGLYYNIPLDYSVKEAIKRKGKK